MENRKLLVLFTLATALSISSCGINRNWNINSNTEESHEGPGDNPFIIDDSEEDEKGVDYDNEAGLPSLPEAKFITRNSNLGIEDSGYQLIFENNDNNISVAIYDKDEDIKTYEAKKPVIVAVKPKSTKTLDFEKQTKYFSCYNSIEQKEYGYLLKGTVSSENGSVFEVSDAYYVGNAGSFAVSRKFYVASQDNDHKDDGFQSCFDLNISDALTGGSPVNKNSFTYFLPSVLYKDDSYIKTNGEGYSFMSKSDNYLMVKETVTGLPVATLRHISSGQAITISHFDIDLTVNGIEGGGEANEVNNKLQYGSIGYNFNDDYGVEFCWPCHEGPTSYDNKGEISRYHTVVAGTTDAYKFAIIPGHEETHNDETIHAYEMAYLYESPEVLSTDELDMDDIYEDNLLLLRSEYRDDLSTSGYGGFPYSIDNPTNNKSEGYSSQMGFVGQQIPLGYNLIRNGLRNNNSGDLNKGRKILNFWTSSTIMGGTSQKFPYVWWQPESNTTWKDTENNPYPSFIRCMVDGAEGMIDAYRIEKAYGNTRNQWYNAIIKIADGLLDVQETDGSFRRAYTQSGSYSAVSTGIASYVADSKLNTPEVIRFLGKVYELTNDTKYKTAALKAADYSYTNIYESIGKYIGGTADNPNYLDKEGAVYAMHGFIAAYQLSTSQEDKDKYLRAAKHATVCSLSWVYMYDFAVPANDSNSKYNVFVNGGTMGFSFVLNGNASGCDNYASFMSFSVYCMYVITGDEFYKHAANVIEKATKYCSNWDGRMKHFKYKALCPEATSISNFAYNGSENSAAARWLAWCSAAFICPLADLGECFGYLNISEINSSLNDLQATYSSYGCGGKPLSS